MITLTKIRELDIEPTVKTRPSFVYAASGLARLDNRLYIVADDEMHLAVFDYQDKNPGSWIRLLPGVLPDDYQQRKKEKPDLESITHIPAHEYAPHGALLVVPSMSRKRRVTGLLLLLGEKQRPTEETLPIDFSTIREKLKTLVEELNVEGVIVNEKTVKLFHRGSKDKSKSAVIELDAKVFLKDLHDSHVINANHVGRTTEYDLGDINGIPLHFTDAVELPDGRVLFLATAENSSNAYDDGASYGSAVGIINRSGKVERITRFDSKEKLEGVNATAHATRLELLLVSDTDDETKPAGLYRSTLDL